MSQDSLVAVGIDLGGTHIKTALVDRWGIIRRKLVRDTGSSLGPEAVLDRIVASVRRLLSEAAIQPTELLGVGVGAPGPLSPERGCIVNAPNLPGWRNVPIRDHLEQALSCHVWLDNDGNAAAYGEFWAGTDREGGDLVMFTLGTGVGTGVVIDGAILHGHFENAGEVGHTIVVPGGLPCPCGQRGCLEQYASAGGVVRRVQAAIQDGEPSLLRDRVRNDHTLHTEEIVNAAAQGDALCTRIWNEACRYLAIATINIQHTFNPARVVFGGGMSQAGDRLLDEIRRQIRLHQWSVYDDLPTLALATLGYDAGVIGAAGLVWRQRAKPGERQGDSSS